MSPHWILEWTHSQTEPYGISGMLVGIVMVSEKRS